MATEKIKARTTSYQDALIASLSKKREAKAYLQAALEEFQEDGNSEALLLALRNLAEAQGGLTELSARTSINRQHLYRILSSKGNPRLQTFGQLLNGLGFHLSVSSN